MSRTLLQVFVNTSDFAGDRLVARFDTFLGASTLDAEAIREPLLRRCICSAGKTQAS
jgi:hypothetical protein